ncbi:hypothetical protein Vretimale_4072 [Volvox reticuliferus]|uniref:Uncharacterized protein n=1 Tax=Volvox reticuliferus TaxID=1737510 RepID=A0A8J4DA27_9CHLO|nr:hypothetical protein Vretimale_4072 [Volvox reticuliferus]
MMVQSYEGTNFDAVISMQLSLPHIEPWGRWSALHPHRRVSPRAPANQEQANAGAAAVPLEGPTAVMPPVEGTAAAWDQEVATALPEEVIAALWVELRHARQLTTAPELHQTASQDQGAAQQRSELQVATGATVKPDQAVDATLIDRARGRCQHGHVRRGRQQ